MADNDANNLPASKNAFSFDPTTRGYIGVVRVFLSPLEGVYFLPDNVVECAPPTSLAPFTSCRLNDAGDGWDVVSDYRRVMLYDTGTASPVANTLQLGERPAKHHTAVPPAIHSDQVPSRNVWDKKAGAWREEPDYRRHAVFDKATGRRVPTLKAGVPLGDSLTTLQPPLPEPYRGPRWNEQLASWELVPDYRGVTYWLPDGSAHTITELGVETPVDALSEAPQGKDLVEGVTPPEPVG